MTAPDRPESLEPLRGSAQVGRQRLGVRGELTLALIPTLTMILVLWLVEVLAHERVLFAALASSAFLIYLDPGHGTNTLRVLAASHLTAAAIGLAAEAVLGSGYVAMAVAMVATILLMVLVDIVHPPAIGTALNFAFRTGMASTVGLFLLALAMVVLLGALQRLAQWMLTRLTAASHAP